MISTTISSAATICHLTDCGGISSTKSSLLSPTPYHVRALSRDVCKWVVRFAVYSNQEDRNDHPDGRQAQCRVRGFIVVWIRSQTEEED
jgi:hypothetical protein